MKKKWIAAVLALAALAGPAFATEASVKALLAKKYTSLPANVQVRKVGIADIYEVNLLGQEAYTNEKVDFLLVGGSMVDASTLEDVTLKRRPQFLRDFFLSLPLENSIKTVHGKGENVLVSFEDPDCPLCRAQHEDWVKNATAFNATVHTFMFPLNIHPDARRKAEFIWCQKDPAAAWSLWMDKMQGLPLDPKGNLSASAPASCAEGVKKVAESEALARSLGYRETPRFIFGNGAGASTVLTTSQFVSAFAVVNKALADLPKAPVAAATPTAKTSPLKK